MDKCFTFLKGKKCSKSAPVFTALGDLDELNAALGLARAFAKKNLKQKILWLQNDLIEIGGFLSGVKKVDLKEKAALLAEKINQMANSSVKTFSRPGANKTSAFLHLARAICRRLERRVAGLKKKSMNPLVAYLNHLSSLLFWLARAVCRRLERRVAGLKKKSMNPLVVYLNHLSSLLFWLAKKEEKIS